jgi:SAM-dependent methyltransferase
VQDTLAEQNQPDNQQDGTPSWLSALRTELDPNSIQLLEALNPQPDWHCLALGAGSGSTSRWLAQRIPAGRVVATGVDLTSLRGIKAPNLELAEHDVTTGDFPESSFDLIYSRYLFCHLPSRDEALARVVSWLKPGGWLLLKDPAKFPFDSSPNATFTKVSVNTMAIYLETVGSDFDAAAPR